MKHTLLEFDEEASHGSFVRIGFFFQSVGDHVVDVFDKDDITLKVVQVFQQRSMPPWAKEQIPLLVSKGLVVEVYSYGIA